MIDELFGYSKGSLNTDSILKESQALHSPIQRPSLQLNYPNNYAIQEL